MKKRFFYRKDNDPVELKFAKAIGAKKLDRKDFEKNPENYKDAVLILRGLRSRRILQIAGKNEIDYYYMDTGYFGNYGKGKIWHRIIKNNLHMDSITDRSKDRFDYIIRTSKRNLLYPKAGLVKPWNKKGSKILLCPPTQKSFTYYGKDYDVWMKNTVGEIKKYTDREIVIREKPESRTARVIYNTIWRALDEDIWAVVTYNSIVAVEAVTHGIPAFCLGPNAASFVSRTDLSKIEDPLYPKRQMWLNNLAYSQFSTVEMESGAAWKILGEKR